MGGWGGVGPGVHVLLLLVSDVQVSKERGWMGACVLWAGVATCTAGVACLVTMRMGE